MILPVLCIFENSLKKTRNMQIVGEFWVGKTSVSKPKFPTPKLEKKNKNETHKEITISG